MKYTIIPLLALVASVTALAQPLKDVIVSYPSDTPDSVVEQGMQAVINGGGTITHEYKLFKGFAAKSPPEALQTVQTMDNKYPAVVEEDQIVHTNS